MTTWFPDIRRSWLERIVIRILKHGEIPKHIAFIMDGNRRYAKKVNQEKMIGHVRGFEKLTEALSWCHDLGITQATLYTFSIENFKRPKEEVDYLMELFRKQANKVLEEFSKIKDYEICIRIYGKIDLLPLDIQQALARMVIETSKFNKFYLNICFAYTSREEINNALNDLQECVAHHIIDPNDINHRTISNAMYSLGLRDPDILIRTSGEIRLSDFLLWQSSFSSVCFFNTLWPEFSIWHLFVAILNYQYECQSVQKSCQQYFELLKEEDLKFCQQIYDEYYSKPSKTGRLNGKQNMYSHNHISFEEFMSERESRIEKCHRYINDKRKQYLYKILGVNSGVKMINVQSNHCSNHLNIADQISTTCYEVSKSF